MFIKGGILYKEFLQFLLVFSMRKRLSGLNMKRPPHDMFKGCKAPATTNVDEAGTLCFSDVCTYSIHRY